MECTQAEAFEQYIRDLRVVRSISRPSFPEGKAPTAVLEEIQTNALRCNALMRQNEALLTQFVYDRDPASLTEEDIQGLSAFAGRLFNYANSEDVGVAFKVHQLLLAAARSREDVPMIVRELYYTGITLHYMNVRDEATGINLLGDAIEVYFTEAAEYMSRYEQLDKNTRQYLIRCVGNTRLGMSRGTHAESCRYLERFRRAMEVIQSAHYHALDPEFPWESYIYSMHMDRMTLLPHLRQEEDPEVARQVLESADYIWGHKKKYKGQDARLQNWRVPYFYAAARYHAGVGSLEDVVKILLESAGSVAQDDYSAEAINRKLVLAALYHHCYYNGKGGYPNDAPSCPEEIKGIVDALSVADSLDAATDNIGRCYNLAKPFRTLLEELRAQSGTRYAPNVVALFEDERFCQQLAENMDAERKRVYLQVYHAGSEEK